MIFFIKIGVSQKQELIFWGYEDNYGGLGWGGRLFQNCLEKTKNERYFFCKHPLGMELFSSF